MDDRIVLTIGSLIVGWLVRGQFQAEPKEPKCHCGCHCGSHCEGGPSFLLTIVVAILVILGGSSYWLIKIKPEPIGETATWSKGKKGVFGQAGKVLTLTS